MSKIQVCTINDIVTTDKTQLCQNVKIGWLAIVTLNNEQNGYYLLNENKNIIGKMLLRSFNSIQIELINNILTSNKSIWSYNVVPKQILNNNYAGKYYKIDIYVDIDMFLEKCNNNSFTRIDHDFIHKLFTTYNAEHKNKKFGDDWKNPHWLRDKIYLIAVILLTVLLIVVTIVYS